MMLTHECPLISDRQFEVLTKPNSYPTTYLYMNRDHFIFQAKACHHVELALSDDPGDIVSNTFIIKLGTANNQRYHIHLQ